MSEETPPEFTIDEWKAVNLGLGHVLTYPHLKEMLEPQQIGAVESAKRKVMRFLDSRGLLYQTWRGPCL